MLTCLSGGHVVDPANGRDAVGDLWLRDGRVVAAEDGARADETIDVSGCIVMAGGIDIHTHVAGTNVNTARLLLPELRARHRGRIGAGVPLDHRAVIRGDGLHDGG